jgi:hypothetical protein
MFRVAGVVDMQGPNLNRTGDVDATELDPNPVPASPPVTDESYFFSSRLPGTKQVDDITINLNMNIGWYQYLITAYTDDVILYWNIYLRAGWNLRWRGFIKSIPMNFAENQLVKLPMVITPTSGFGFTQSAAPTLATTTTTTTGS